MAGEVLRHKDYEFAIFTEIKEIDLYQLQDPDSKWIKKLVNVKLPENVTWDYMANILIFGNDEEKSKLAGILYDSYVFSKEK